MQKMKRLFDDLGVEYQELPVMERLPNAPSECAWFIAVEDTFFLFDEAEMFLGTWDGDTRIFYFKGFIAVPDSQKETKGFEVTITN